MNCIKLIVCYYGTFPQWMNIWLKSCELNSDIDFMIVTDVKIDNLPSNVSILNMSMEELKKHFTNILGFPVSLKSPYKLCDFKPVYGKAFEKELEGYEFWGYCDIDLIWGHIRNFITKDILDNYDLIGQYGHLMIYKNNKEMNELFMQPGGTFSYKTVFTNDENYSYDEMSGMDLIAYGQQIKQYRALKIANVSPSYNRFKIEGTVAEKEIFVWKDGKILRISGKNKINIEEFAYIHFSGKKPENKTDKDHIEKSNVYLAAKCMENRENNQFTLEEIEEKNTFIDEKTDKKEKKIIKKRKIVLVLKKTLKQKIIWLKVHRGVSKFNKIKRENR